MAGERESLRVGRAAFSASETADLIADGQRIMRANLLARAQKAEAQRDKAIAERDALGRAAHKVLAAYCLPAKPDPVEIESAMQDLATALTSIQGEGG